MKLLDIGEVAIKSGVRSSALRYYEEIGLITSVARHGLRRQFKSSVLLQLQLITMGKLAGFSLTEIADILANNEQLNLPRQRLREKANAIDQQIAELTILRDTLNHIADCRAPSHLECPTFRQLLQKTNKLEKNGSGKKETQKTGTKTC